MYTIQKEFHFSASHQLDHLPEGHQCARLHGHNYIVVMVLKSESVDDRGFVRDYAELDVVKRFIDETLDHRHLNDVFGAGSATTAENIAKAMFLMFSSALPELHEVRVSETPKTWASYQR